MGEERSRSRSLGPANGATSARTALTAGPFPADLVIRGDVPARRVGAGPEVRLVASARSQLSWILAELHRLVALRTGRGDGRSCLRVGHGWLSENASASGESRRIALNVVGDALRKACAVLAQRAEDSRIRQ